MVAQDNENLLTREVYLANKDKLGPKATINAGDFRENLTESVWICRYCGSFQVVDAQKRSNFMYMPSKFAI